MSGMINFFQETIDFMKSHNLYIKDVSWVGSQDGEFVMSWGKFKAIADFEYDNGYGLNEIPLDLVIVGDNWWLEREEYDGSEWWVFKTIPTKKCVKNHFVFGGNNIQSENNANSR